MDGKDGGCAEADDEDSPDARLGESLVERVRRPCHPEREADSQRNGCPVVAGSPSERYVAALDCCEYAEQDARERVHEHRRRRTEARENEHRVSVTLERQQRQQQQGDCQVLREVARVERTMEGLIRRPDHMRWAEYPQQHGEREPRGTASRDAPGVQKDRVEQQREDWDADERQQPSG